MKKKGAGSGYSDPSSRSIVIEQLTDEQNETFKILLHEFVHLASKTKFKIYPEDRQVGASRHGYTINDDNKRFFRDLNEAVTEKIALAIYMKNIKKIQEHLNIQSDSIHIAYYNKVEFLERVIEQIAKTRNESTNETWNRIKQGYFTGEMMHLRDIEKVLGKGSLREYAEEDM